MARSHPLPQRTPEQVREAFPTLRQSLLATADSCMLMTRFELEAYAFTNAAQARGVLFHRFAAEVLRTLRRTGEIEMEVAEALEVLYEVCEQRDVPDAEVVVLPAKERRLLRICAIMLVWDAKAKAPRQWRMARLIDVERRLYAEIPVVGDDGVSMTRTISGQPDALLADPPDGAVVLDWKTTRKPPPKGEGERHDDPDHISYLGYFQQRVYAVLVFRNFSAVDRVRLREFYPLADHDPDGPVRTATVYRDDLEHIERELATEILLLDRALAGGSKSKLWRPSPGRHCAYCPKPTSCPIEADVRVFGQWEGGGITSDAQAAKLGGEYVLAKTTGSRLHEALKARHEETGHPIPVRSAKGRAEIRWGWSANGAARKFGVHVPDTSDRGPKDVDLAAAFEAAAARAKG